MKFPRVDLSPNRSYRLDALEQKVWRMEKVIWYIASIITIKYGWEVAPSVIAILGG